MAAKHAVKSCGNAHAYCSKCKPEVAAKLRRPKPPRRADLPPCRNCGSCDACLGIVAPEGMKFCRKCGETKPLEAFGKPTAGRGYRNQCKKCKNGGAENVRCVTCRKFFTRTSDEVTQCVRCRPRDTMPCERCGTEFVRSMSLRRYCSAECAKAAFAEKRAARWREAREAALQAYGGPNPACACCGESTRAFLAIDHVNGGGHRQFKELGGGGYAAWLRKNSYPAGFQVLCHNCNMGRQLNGGICPHL